MSAKSLNPCIYETKGRPIRRNLINKKHLQSLPQLLGARQGAILPVRTPIAALTLRRAIGHASAASAALERLGSLCLRFNTVVARVSSGSNRLRVNRLLGRAKHGTRAAASKRENIIAAATSAIANDLVQRPMCALALFRTVTRHETKTASKHLVSGMRTKAMLTRAIQVSRAPRGLHCIPLRAIGAGS